MSDDSRVRHGDYTVMWIWFRMADNANVSGENTLFHLKRSVTIGQWSTAPQVTHSMDRQNFGERQLLLPHFPVQLALRMRKTLPARLDKQVSLAWQP